SGSGRKGVSDHSRPPACDRARRIRAPLDSKRNDQGSVKANTSSKLVGTLANVCRDNVLVTLQRAHALTRLSLFLRRRRRCATSATPLLLQRRSRTQLSQLVSVICVVHIVYWS